MRSRPWVKRLRRQLLVLAPPSLRVERRLSRYRAMLANRPPAGGNTR